MVSAASDRLTTDCGPLRRSHKPSVVERLLNDRCSRKRSVEARGPNDSYRGREVSLVPPSSSDWVQPFRCGHRATVSTERRPSSPIAVSDGYALDRTAQSPSPPPIGRARPRRAGSDRTAAHARHEWSYRPFSDIHRLWFVTAKQSLAECASGAVPPNELPHWYGFVRVRSQVSP